MSGVYHPPSSLTRELALCLVKKASSTNTLINLMGYPPYIESMRNFIQFEFCVEYI